MHLSTRGSGTFPALLVLLFATAFCAGTASGAASAAGLPAVAPPAITRVAPKPFVPDDPSASLRATIVVRLATAGEQEAVRARLESSGVMSRNMAGTAVLGLGVGAAATAGGMYAGGAILGGILLLPSAIAMYAHDRHVADHVSAALAPEALVEELQAVLPSTQAIDSPTLSVELIILDYGLLARTEHDRNEPLCLIADLGIEVKRNGESLYQEMVHIQPFLRSADAPAPVCRSYETWGKHDARMLIRARQDLAASLARMVRSRLDALHWEN